MKKLMSILIMILVFAFMITGCENNSEVHAAASDISNNFILTMQINNSVMTVNGVQKEIDEGKGTTPVIVNSRTLVPIRAIIEAMEGKILWEQNTQKITIELSDKIIELIIGSNIAYVNDEQKELDTAPEIINGRTLLPIRFISENLGYNVDWNANEQIITIENTSIALSEEAALNNQLEETGKTIVVYFSNTGTTEKAANYISEELNADIFKIKAVEPYTSEDLNYSNSSSRANIEQNDTNARPEIENKIENIEQFDVVYLGYPIWWGQAPKIMSTFLESYDFSGKTIIPFCTSHSSGIGSSDTNLHSFTDNAQWISGKRFGGEVSKNEVKEWLEAIKKNIN